MDNTGVNNMQAMRRELTDKEIQMAARLRAIWDDKKKAQGFTQEMAGDAMGGWSQGAVGHYLNARIPLNTDAIFRFCKFLGCQPQEINPEFPTNFVASGSGTLVSIEQTVTDPGTVQEPDVLYQVMNGDRKGINLLRDVIMRIEKFETSLRGETLTADQKARAIVGALKAAMLRNEGQLDDSLVAAAVEAVL